VRDPQIAAHRSSHLQECHGIHFTQKGDELSSGSLSCDGGADDPAFHLAALADTGQTHLQKLYPAFHDGNAVMVVFGRIGPDRILLALEPRRLALAAEEPVIAICEVSQARLECRSVDFFQLERIISFLERGELFLAEPIGKPDAGKLIGFFPQIEIMVEDETGIADGLGDEAFLQLIGI